MPPSHDKLAIRLLEPEIRIPGGIEDLESFRSWTRCPSFPERGRIDWIQGCLEVDVSAENLHTHGNVKSAIAGALVRWVHDPRKGMVYIDRARVTQPEANLSVEPDVLVVLRDSLRAGRIAFVPGAAGPEGAMELEGAADLVVEVVSRSSRTKDWQRLRKAYHAAGVREYWIADALQQPVTFEVLIHRPEGFVSSPADDSGFRSSEVLGGPVRLIRLDKLDGLVFYELQRR